MRRTRTIKRLFAIFILFAMPAYGWSQDGTRVSPAQPFVQYSVADGMTQAQATGFTQDETGYLWIATERGLNRFDGREFGHVTISDGLRTNELTAVEAIAGNTVLVGDADGYISIVHDSLVTSTISPPDDAEGAVTDIVVHDTTAYFSIERVGLATIDLSNPAAASQLVYPTNRPIKDLAVHDDELYFVMGYRLYQLHADYSASVILDQVSASSTGNTGQRWLVRDDGTVGTVQIDGAFSAHPFSVQGFVHGIDVAGDGTVWVLTDHELAGYLPATVDSAAQQQLYVNVDDARILYVDRENLVWLSAESKLERLQGNRFQHFDLRTGPGSHNVWSITEDTAGRMYFGTHQTILRLDRDDVLVELGGSLGIPSGAVRDMVTDQDGSIWAGVRGVGLYRVDQTRLHADLVAGTASLEILDLTLDASGALWIATLQRGVFRLDTRTSDLRQFPTPDSTSVYTIDATADGGVWYGADDIGLVRLLPAAGGEYARTVFGEEAGLGDVVFNHINARAGDAVWIGAIDGGLFRFKDGQAINIGPQTPLFDQSSYLVEPLLEDKLIVGGEQGLYLIDPAARTATHFGALDGFVALETNAHAGFRDSNGHLWIGTIDGATRMNLDVPVPPSIELRPQVLSVRSSSGREEVKEGTSIPWSGRNVAIQYAAVSLRSPRGIQYSYRLNGMHEFWLPMTLNRSIEFTGLPPGDYRFEVRARFEGGTWGDHVASRGFAVLKPFWLQIWFILATILTFALLIGGLMRLRTRRIMRANRRLREEVNARTQSIVETNNQLEASNKQLANEIQERRKADDARRESESQMQLAFDNTPIGMGMLGRNTHLRGANPALREMLWPDQEITETLPDFLERLRDDSSDAVKELLMSIASGETDRGTVDAYCRNTQEQMLHTTISLSAVRNVDGSFRYALLHMQDVTEARQLTDLLEVQANYDELTGLLNRRAFEVELTSICSSPAEEESTNYLLFMDLDRFKVVNDTSGHSAGDALLKEIADIMRTRVRASDILGRLGGDEFGLILRAANKAAASRIAEAIRIGIEEYRFHWENETHRIGISIGVVPIDSSSVQELEQLADAACYSAKNEGRNCVYFVEKGEMSVQENRGEARWVQRLRSAMDNRLFALYGQTIKPLKPDMKGPERIEVLLRMRDPVTRKLIPPGAFLPAAERHGLGTELDQWVISNLLDLLFVHDALGAAEHCYWVNLSGASVGDKRFADFLVGAMRDSPLPPGLVNFEITETAVIRNLSEARRLIVALRDMGCQFALDDFGSGLSSFAYLKKLPVDCVKIDGMFIRDIVTDDTDRIFVKSIIDIAATMGIMSVTEFVENDDILDIVRDLGADYAQGFGVHRPEMISPEFPGNAFRAVGSLPTETPLLRGKAL